MQVIYKKVVETEDLNYSIRLWVTTSFLDQVAQDISEELTVPDGVNGVLDSYFKLYEVHEKALCLAQKKFGDLECEIGKVDLYGFPIKFKSANDLLLFCLEL